MSRRVGIVQAGFGNSSTIVNMLRIQGFDAHELRDPSAIDGYSHLVLPGVGHWSRGSDLLSTHGWDDAIRGHVLKGFHLLGVCLGMQLLGKSSEEGAGYGLSLIDMMTTSLEPDGRRTNVGWKELEAIGLRAGSEVRGPFYFTHSFGVKAEGRSFEVATIQGSSQAVALVNQGNIWGAQFHPERSNVNGAAFLAAFVQDRLVR